MTSIVWSLEWRVALRRRRVFALNITIPLLLLVPLAFGAAPPYHAAAVEAVLFVLFGTFGGAIPLVRDAQSGLLRRIALTGLSPRRWMAERILAHAAVDTLQLLPALALVLGTAALRPGDAALAAPATLATLIALPPTLAATLVAANALGTAIAALARSIAEGALFCAVVALLMLHAGGVFRTPAPDSLGAVVERLSPFRPLHEVLLEAQAAPAAQAIGPGPLAWTTSALIAAVVALGLCTALGPTLLARLAESPAE